MGYYSWIEKKFHMLQSLAYVWKNKKYGAQETHRFSDERRAC